MMPKVVGGASNINNLNSYTFTGKTFIISNLEGFNENIDMPEIVKHSDSMLDEWNEGQDNVEYNNQHQQCLPPEILRIIFGFLKLDDLRAVAQFVSLYTCPIQDVLKGQWKSCRK